MNHRVTRTGLKANDILKAFREAGKRTHLIGDLDAGVIAALDLEGRLFTVLEGEVLNRVNLAAIRGESTQKAYLNPGGDGLWPAPEGTSLGYQYSTGSWRVAPGLRAARYQVAEAGKSHAEIAAEVDLVNAQGRGVPTVFERKITVVPQKQSVTVRVRESITYLGRTEFSRASCLLAPWTLCQFDCGPKCAVEFPCKQKDAVWDLYSDPSDRQRTWQGRLCRTSTDGSQRYQIALDAAVPWIDFRDPQRRLVVRRTARALPEGQSYIDIRDAAPVVAPSRKRVRYSVSSDAGGFMEIQAVGGCPPVLRSNTAMSLEVSTDFARTPTA